MHDENGTSMPTSTRWRESGSVYGVVADAVAPVFAPAGFDDWHASSALMTGFVAKEVVVASMAQSYSIDTGDEDEQQQGEGTLGAAMRESFDHASGGHGKAAAVAFMLFTLAYDDLRDERLGQMVRIRAFAHGHAPAQIMDDLGRDAGAWGVCGPEFAHRMNRRVWKVITASRYATTSARRHTDR